MADDIVLSYTDYHLYVSSIASVHYILFCKEMCSRNADSSKLVKTQEAEPEFISSFEYQHYRIAFFYAVRSEEICCFVAVMVHLSKSEPGFITLVVAPYHSVFFRVFSSDGINNIISKVEVFRNINFKILIEIFI